MELISNALRDFDYTIKNSQKIIVNNQSIKIKIALVNGQAKGCLRRCRAKIKHLHRAHDFSGLGALC